jgi:uracil-DNA glycosylase family 4
MIVGKNPGQDEMTSGRNYVGRTGEHLSEKLDELEVSAYERGDWYVCNLLRWPNLNPRGGALSKQQIADCLPLLQQELRLVRPDFVLCLGAEATKFICGPEHSVHNMIGRYVTLDIPIHDVGEPAQFHTARAMSMVHPAQVLRQTELEPQEMATLNNFIKLTRGEEFVRKDTGLKIQYVYKLRELREIVDAILAQPGLKRIAVDAEWHGNHPREPGAYVRSIQISAHDDWGVVIVLAHQGGEPAFWPGKEAAIAELKRLLDRDDVQIIGSFFAADMPWLRDEGLDLRHRFAVPENVEDMHGGNYAGGFDVAIGLHSVHETADFKLEIMCSRLIGAPRWDFEVTKWRQQYCAQHKLKAKELEGYGECPDNILFPYGGLDAINTRRLQTAIIKMLNNDRHNNNSWVPFHISMRAQLAFNEMGEIGVKIDRERIDELTDLYVSVRDARLRELREIVKWPNFNHRSNPQSVELLFGEEYNQKRDPEGNPVRLRPEGAESLRLEPVKSTGQKGTPWERVVERDELHKFTPCTDKEVCGILGMHNDVAMKLRDVRMIDQILKSVLKPPEVTSEGELVVDPRTGRRLYKGGMAAFICADARVRTFFSQLMETGRSSSSRPPLQNLSKRREGDYKRILGDDYRYKIRSFLMGNMDPSYGEITVLVEADYKGAELYGMATQARDATMISHCERANLPDGHPDKYDIHSNICVTSFRLNCAPTQKALEDAGLLHLRVGAKNIIFGVSYGRMAAACARQCKEEGADITERQAQQVIDGIFRMYPGIPILQDALRERVETPGWVRNCFGRYRRFIKSSDRKVQGDLERQALNFPFQSMVADAISKSLDHLYYHPMKAELGYNILLNIHDAIVLEVPIRSLDYVYNELLDDCMVARVPFQACDLEGNPHSDSPTYRFGIDKDVCMRWGEKLTVDQCDAIGISHIYAAA